VAAHNAGLPTDRAEHEALGLANTEIERQIVGSKIANKANALAALDFLETERDLDQEDRARLFKALRAYIEKTGQ
jgi:hypothetical protein